MNGTLDRKFIERLVYRTHSATRFTQDSPVMPDVWIAYAESGAERLDLILTPHVPVRPAELAIRLREKLRARKTESEARIAYNQACVVASLTLEELMTVVVPMSSWWRTRAAKFDGRLASQYVRYLRQDRWGTLKRRDSRPDDRPTSMSEGLRIPLRIVHAIFWARIVAKRPMESPPSREEVAFPSAKDLLAKSTVLRKFRALLREMAQVADSRARESDKADAVIDIEANSLEQNVDKRDFVFSVNRNRSGDIAILRSVPAIKADAARRLFLAPCRDLRWAVLDSGISARHPAFADHAALPEGLSVEAALAGDGWARYSRVVKTYDFTLVRRLLGTDEKEWETLPDHLKEKRLESPELFQELRHRLQVGRDIDWSLLEPFLEVPHDKSYPPPYADHGTHVAGILAAHWKRGLGEEDAVGVCPDIKLIDMRVFDRGTDDTEFALMAAMQFLRDRNAHADIPFVHGANVSMSFLHDVSNYACGRTPVCEECQRLVNSGIVVVAAAGNEGYLRYTTSKGPKEGYFSVSITDPGNAEAVITVGSTHRYAPHAYGVSYFSSRGPTGDGRSKPDLVAPGEKIESVIADDPTVLATMDGTSMAAPHVSGAAALLIARHSELAGDPARIKKILCETATDLGRERYFQGYGMVDVLRAIQSV